MTTPTHFTPLEGGLWLEWDGGEVSKSDFNKFYPPEDYKHAPPYVIINGREVHAFAFDFNHHGDPLSRWDCVSGWTRKEGQPYG